MKKSERKVSYYKCKQKSAMALILSEIEFLYSSFLSLSNILPHAFLSLNLTFQNYLCLKSIHEEKRVYKAGID